MDFDIRDISDVRLNIGRDGLAVEQGGIGQRIHIIQNRIEELDSILNDYDYIMGPNGNVPLIDFGHGGLYGDRFQHLQALI